MVPGDDDDRYPPPLPPGQPPPTPTYDVMELELIADIEGMGERMVEVFFYVKFCIYVSISTSLIELSMKKD